MVVKGNFAERICPDRTASRRSNGEERRKIAGETKQFVCTGEMWARQHYVLPASSLFSFTLTKQGMGGCALCEAASFSADGLRARSLNQFHRRDDETKAPQVRVGAKYGLSISPRILFIIFLGRERE